MRDGLYSRRPSACTKWAARLRPSSLLIEGPSSLLREPTYHYNLGCYDAVLGNLDEAARHLETSFQMDTKVSRDREIRPRLEGGSRIAGQMTADESAADRVQAIFECNFVRGAEVGASVAVWQDGRQAFCLCQRVEGCCARSAVDPRHDGARMVGDQGAFERMRAPCARSAPGRELVNTGIGILAGVCAKWQRGHHCWRGCFPSCRSLGAHRQDGCDSRS